MRFSGFAKAIGLACLVLVMLASESAFANNGGSWGSSQGSWGSSGGCCGSWGGGHVQRWTPIRNWAGRVQARRASRASSGGFVGRSTRFGCCGNSFGCCGGFYNTTYSYQPSGVYYGSGVISGADCCDGSIISTVPLGQSILGKQPTPENGTPTDANKTPTVPNTDAGAPAGNQAPAKDPAVGPEGIDTRLENGPRDQSVLMVRVPDEARVFINGKPTTTTGKNRRYVARDMKLGKAYRYNLKVVIDRDGKELVQTETIRLKPGFQHQLAFDFVPVATTLTVDVPENAKVTLCGMNTTTLGNQRSYTTKDMIAGQTWKGYSVVVEFEKDGKLVTQQQTIDIVAGEKRHLAFDFEQPGSAGQTSVVAR